ncbi:BEX3 isoform 2 [Pan troglodytes]|uniref:BEX3 isoform 2 n=1 Tax=Pan troglodytes TaxID=9598 RepID=A0A2J8K3H0_PANTR|nr:BEX3 isoform 2 [Pan troglodytes]
MQTGSCRATQPSVQSSLASGYQLPAALSSAGWHPARGKAEQVCEAKCLRGAPRGENPEEKETARIGPGKRRDGAAYAEWRGRPPFGRR